PLQAFPSQLVRLRSGPQAPLTDRSPLHPDQHSNREAAAKGQPDGLQDDALLSKCLLPSLVLQTCRPRPRGRFGPSLLLPFGRSLMLQGAVTLTFPDLGGLQLEIPSPPECGQQESHS